MILHTIPNNWLPFWICNRHRKISIFQLLLIFNIDLPPQGIHILIIVTFLRNIPPMLLPHFILYNILLLIQVRISLFRHLFLRHICRYNHLMTQTIKQIQIHTFSKHARFSNLRIPDNSQQFT